MSAAVRAAAAPSVAAAVRRRTKGRSKWRSVAIVAASLAAGIVLWQVLSMIYGPLLIASPATTVQSAIELTLDGRLPTSIAISLQRIAIGWGLGLLVGVPLGVLMGRIRLLRAFLDPYIEFLRFVPPIALVTLMIVWFGIGEVSKVMLIFYTAVFIVTINTIAGVASIPQQRLLAAEKLGAGRGRILWEIVLPSIVPYIVTAARLALGNSFLTIVSAEIVAANSGLGAMIWQARNYSRIDWVFVGIFALGILGFLCDRLIRFVGQKALGRFGVAA